MARRRLSQHRQHRGTRPARCARVGELSEARTYLQQGHTPSLSPFLLTLRPRTRVHLSRHTGRFLSVNIIFANLIALRSGCFLLLVPFAVIPRLQAQELSRLLFSYYGERKHPLRFIHGTYCDQPHLGCASHIRSLDSRAESPTRPRHDPPFSDQRACRSRRATCLMRTHDVLLRLKYVSRIRMGLRQLQEFTSPGLELVITTRHYFSFTRATQMVHLHVCNPFTRTSLKPTFLQITGPVMARQWYGQTSCYPMRARSREHRATVLLNLSGDDPSARSVGRSGGPVLPLQGAS